MKLLRILVIILITVFHAVSPASVSAEDAFFTVEEYDGSDPHLFTSYEEAYAFYLEQADSHENLLLREGSKILHMEYGIVEFPADEACSFNVDYHSVKTDRESVLNGCYGSDAAYLSTDKDGRKVYFLISDETGYADIDQVILHPFQELDSRISSYSVDEGILHHNIRTQLSSDYFSYSLLLGKAPAQLQEGKSYFSYDGHYFYDDFRKMIDDERNSDHSQAVNSEAYYSYYQFLSHHSLSSYQLSELERHFYGDLGMNRRMFRYLDRDGDSAVDEMNCSQLYGAIDDFFICQQMFGTNAMMLLSSAICESAYGRSHKAFSANNLYSGSAYETENERAGDRYDSIANSIYSYSRYFLSSLFSNHAKSLYAGTAFGNLAAGINRNYSIDPYYGEKCASVYHELDRSLGGKDENVYALGIIREKERVSFYKDEELENLRFVLKDIRELSFVILDENESSYRIQIDAGLTEDHLYDFEESVAYVAKTDIDRILNPEKIHSDRFTAVCYDFAGGSYHEYESLALKIRENDEPAIIPPVRAGYEFIAYEDGKAVYRKIEQIEVIHKSSGPIELGNDPDFADFRLRVRYDDGTEKNLPLDTDMISAYDPSIPGKQVLTVRYCGVETEMELEFSSEIHEIRKEIRKALQAEDYLTVRKDIGLLDYPLSFAQIRTIDEEYREKNERNYVIRDQTQRYNLSISGLDLSLADRKSFSFVDDTYYVLVDPIRSSDEEKITALAEGYGFEKEEGISISFRFNYQDIELQGPAIVQLDLKDKKNDLIYSVYHLDKGGNVVKCRTTQSDHYVQFMIHESGAYEVLSRPSANTYAFTDSIEDLSYENMGYDNHRINIRLMLSLLLNISGLIGITLYYIIANKRKQIWKDFRRSLPTAEFAQDGKPKN